jgi:M6 family metalloprotease-like protein
MLAVVIASGRDATAIPPPPHGGVELPTEVREALRHGIGRLARPVLTLPLSAADKAAGRAALGKRTLPVLMADFPDRNGVQAPAALAAELFGTWPAGSLRDYYWRVSYGQLEIDGHVAGWYRAAQPAAVYEGSSNGLDIFATVNAGDFVREVVAQADAAGFDWGPYDNDGPDGLANSGDDDGYVDVVFVVHAGHGGECGGTSYLWSHSYFLAGWGGGSYVTRTPRAGRPGEFLRVDDYTLQPELSCAAPDRLIEIGVFCHEYGHALGLPDLYDTRDQAPGRGIGAWGLMGYGVWGGDGESPQQPVAPCAWSRVQLGWVEPHVIAGDGAEKLAAIALGPDVFRIWSGGAPGPEYFLVENRQRLLDDNRLPGQGLLVWHIDERIVADGIITNAVNAGPVYGVALEQADGRDDLHGGAVPDNGDAGDPWPGNTEKRTFSGGTFPSTAANDGTATDVALREIADPAATMNLYVEIGVPPLTAVRDAPAGLAAGPCAPNPANPRTAFEYYLVHGAAVTIGVYDLAGRRVRTLLQGDRPAGAHRTVWDGRDDGGRALPSGVYFLQVVAGSERALSKVTLVR